MKRILFISTLLLSLSTFAQSERYQSAMQKNLALFDSVQNTEKAQALAASFERIGDAEKTEWLPYYYAALAMLTPAWMDPKIDKDQNAVKVKALIDKGDALAKSDADRSELQTLRNMVATQQMLVDPQSRYATYGAESASALKKAQELNPNNPRAFYLEGIGIFNTPEQFGGGKTKAKPVLEKAVSLFNSEQVKPLYPTWGKKEAEQFLAQAQ